MKKLLNSLTLLVAVGALSTLAGCELYFGNSGNGDDSSGGSGSDEGGGGSGWGCGSNSDCASGCYCGSNGTCTEGGFCTQDSDCGSGYHCDTSRSSCEPNTPTQPTSCYYDNQCPEGQYCAPDDTCTATCTCTDDQMALDQGFGWCDETRSTCLPGADPAGSCGGNITCTTAMPTCPSGSVALSIDGCWIGTCQVYGSCDVTPGCSRINDESDCLDRAADCTPDYTGLNCTKTDGTACHSGDTGCTCESFEFATCTDKTATIGRLVQDSQGRTLDASQLLLH